MPSPAGSFSEDAPRPPDAAVADARSTLQRALAPRVVAVVGASDDPKSLGNVIFRNLTSGRFTGTVHPVHPTRPAVRGVRAYPTLEDVPDPVDLAVIAVPARAVPEVAEAAGRAGAAGIVVISAGFKEVGGEGAEREAALVDVCRRYGMRMVGPNCMGVINHDPGVGLNATFCPSEVLPGRVALMSQSGALGMALLENASALHLGIARFVSMGNKADVSGNDLLELWGDDPDISQILLYVESFGNPRNFVRLARRVGQRKPILAVKAGRSRGGARAAGSHTGAMAETDRAVEALFEQCGVLRAATIEELFDLAQALDLQPLPSGKRVGIVTNSGGPGILAADAVEAEGLELAELAPATGDALRDGLPPEASTGNPVDLLASGTARDYRRSLELVLDDPAVDAVLAVYTPPIVTDEEEIARAIVEAGAAHPAKPLLAVFLGRGAGSRGFRCLVDGGVPTYAFPENAVRTLRDMLRLRTFRDRPAGEVRDLPMNLPRIRALVTSAGPGGWLAQGDALDLLEAAGVPVAPHRTVPPDPDAAASAAAELGFPVVVKGEAPHLVHKSDAGAVALHLASPDGVREAAAGILQRLRHAGHEPSGLLVMAEVAGGEEALAGVTQDPKFGPLVAFGLGGIHAEVLGDVVFRLAPLTDADARRMVRGLRAYPLLAGHRGGPPGDLPALQEVLERLARLATEVPEVAELDANPLVVLPEGRGVVAVDARVRVHPTDGDDDEAIP